MHGPKCRCTGRKFHGKKTDGTRKYSTPCTTIAGNYNYQLCTAATTQQLSWTTNLRSFSTEQLSRTTKLRSFFTEQLSARQLTNYCSGTDVVKRSKVTINTRSENAGPFEKHTKYYVIPGMAQGRFSNCPVYMMYSIRIVYQCYWDSYYILP